MLRQHLLGRPGCLLIAEVGQAHDGSLGTAHAFIEGAADVGADAIKFQTHIATAESTPSEPWRVKFSPQDATRFDYWRRMEFTADQWAGIAQHASDRGLLFISSAFSIQAVDLLRSVRVAAWKVASGELTNPVLLSAMLAGREPMILSTGMSTWDEIDDAVQRVQQAGSALAVLQCTSAYPCPPERVGLNVIEQLRARYRCDVGLSDHSGTMWPGLATATLGGDVLELHVTLSRRAFGPDVTSSLTFDEFGSLVEGVRFIESVREHPVDKDAVADQLSDMRALFTKSVVAARPIRAGSVLTSDDLTVKKPGGGTPASDLHLFVGRVLRRDVAPDEQLALADTEVTE